MDTFALQIIARGSYLDTPFGDETTYSVEVITIRLNHVALQKWILSECFNTRNCYEDGEAGDAQWKAHKAKQTKLREQWKARVLVALGIDLNPESEGISITQSQSEVFTVVRISRLT